MNLKTRYIRLLLKFRHAFNGLATAFKTQISFRIHIIIALLTYISGILLNLSLTEWALVNSAIMFVVVTELMNTAIEHICDFIHPNQSPKIKIIKDIAAGAVLVSVIDAIIIGGLVFIPEIMILF